MNTKPGFGVRMDARIESRPPFPAGFEIGSVWDVECFDRHGRLKWAERNLKNIVTNEGLDAALDILFHAATQITTWYLAIFESDTTPAAGDTYASPSYTESSAYDEATRPEYVEAAASGQSITNSANKATFTINATKTVYGAALVGGGTDANTKGDTAGGGTLFASVRFSSARPVVATDVIKVTCTVSGSNVA